MSRITSKDKRRRYKLHYNLRKKGNEVNARERSVTRRAKKLPDIEEKWCNELVGKGYMIGDGLLPPPPMLIN